MLCTNPNANTLDRHSNRQDSSRLSKLWTLNSEYQTHHLQSQSIDMVQAKSPDPAPFPNKLGYQRKTNMANKVAQSEPNENRPTPTPSHKPEAMRSRCNGIRPTPMHKPRTLSCPKPYCTQPAHLRVFVVCLRVISIVTVPFSCHSSASD